MKKILLQGPDIDINAFSGQENLLIIYKNEEINKYFETPHIAHELFIYAHGCECFQEKNVLSYLFLQLPNKNNSNNLESANSILSKIVTNTIDNKLNIIHIFACHAGAAHHNLQEVKGNFILCTYASPKNTLWSCRIENLFNIRNNSNNLGEFIINNLPLLANEEFTISYKLDSDNIKTFNLAYKPTKVISINDFAEFLQNTYHKLREFYEIQEQSYPELFSTDNFPKIKTYTKEELKISFSSILALYYSDFILHKIEYLSKETDSSYIFTVGLKKIGIIDLTLNKTAEINDLMKNIITQAINTDRLPITSKLFNTIFNIKPNTEDENHNINTIKNDILAKSIKSATLEVSKQIINEVETIPLYILYNIFSSTFSNLEKEQAVKLIAPKMKYIDSKSLEKILLDFKYLPEVIEEMINKTTQIIGSHFSIASHYPEITNLLWNKYLKLYRCVTPDIFSGILQS